MDLSYYEAGNLMVILEDLVSTCDVKKGDGANVVGKGLWLTPNQCYMISSLISKINRYLYDKEDGKTVLSERILEGSYNVK